MAAHGAAPDVVVSAISGPAAGQAGRSIAVHDTTLNRGSAAAGASTTRFYLSADRTKGAGDVRLTGGDGVPKLAAGQSSPGTTNSIIPGGTQFGTYYLIGCADDTRLVAESSETNNCRATSAKVQIFGRGLFVAPRGSDSNPGTMAQPKHTIQAAIAAVAGQTPIGDVYAAAGSYTGPVSLATGVDVYGGFDTTEWTRSLNATRISGAPEAALASSVTGASLNTLTLQGALDTGSSSVYGLRAADSTLALKQVKVTTPAAADGTDGSGQTSPPTAAGNGGMGGPGVENSGFGCSSNSAPTLGTAGINTVTHMNGGIGGAAGLASQSGANGALAPGGPGAGAGGAGTPPLQGNWAPPQTPYWGHDGAAGSAGAGGSAGAPGYDASGYLPTDGGTGGVGGAGKGGGGGGGGGGGTSGCDSYGGAGGGGGAGGTPGAGGGGGGSGGGSIGVYLWNTTATITGGSVTTGAGGDGGSGADGQPGGAGGHGGGICATPTFPTCAAGNNYGGPNDQDDGSNGARGGEGGAGGDGGDGGGGAGGPSIGILLASGSTAPGAGSLTFSLGPPGTGGTSSGNAGPTGTQAQTFTTP